MKKFRMVSFVFGVWVAATLAQAASVGINFYAASGSGAVTGTTGPVSQSNWNNVVSDLTDQMWGYEYGYYFNSDGQNLKNSDGVVQTGMNLSQYYEWQGWYSAWPHSTTGNFGVVSPAATQAEQLYLTSLQGTEAANISLEGIPYATYDV